MKSVCFSWFSLRVLVPICLQRASSNQQAAHVDELSEVLEKLGAKDWMGDRLGFAQRKKKKPVGGWDFWVCSIGCIIYMYNIIVSLYNSCWDIYYPVHSDLNMYTSQIIIFLVESLTKKKQHRQHRLTATARGPGDSGDLTKPIGMR